MTGIAKKLTGLTLLAGMGLGGAGCATNTGNGALIGGAAGAGLGALAGGASRHGSAAGGALFGGAVGALVGAIIGSEADRAERHRYYDNAPAPYPPPPPYYYDHGVEYRRVDAYGPGYHDVYYEPVR